MTDRMGTWVKLYGMAPGAEGMKIERHPRAASFFGDDRPGSSNRDARFTAAHLPLLPVQIVGIPLQDRAVWSVQCPLGQRTPPELSMLPVRRCACSSRMKNRGQ